MQDSESEVSRDFRAWWRLKFTKMGIYMTTATLNVKGSATRWWLAIEPLGTDIEKPHTSRRIQLETGVDHAVIYYAQGQPGASFEVTISVGEARLITIERTISSKGFIYGHKGFLP